MQPFPVNHQDAGWNHRLYPHAKRDRQAKHLGKNELRVFGGRLTPNSLKKRKERTRLREFPFSNILNLSRVQLSGVEQTESCRWWVYSKLVRVAVAAQRHALHRCHASDSHWGRGLVEAQTPPSSAPRSRGTEERSSNSAFYSRNHNYTGLDGKSSLSTIKHFSFRGSTESWCLLHPVRWFMLEIAFEQSISMLFCVRSEPDGSHCMKN